MFIGVKRGILCRLGISSLKTGAIYKAALPKEPPV